MQSAAVMGIMLIAIQATITLELKLSLPATTGGSPKSLGVVDNALKKSKGGKMKLYLPRVTDLKFVISFQLKDMLKYMLGKLTGGSDKLMQSAAVMGIMLIAIQATITLELNDH